jgi:hypothetical protein
MPSPPSNARPGKEKRRVTSSKPNGRCSSIEAELRALAKNQASSARAAIHSSRACVSAAAIPRRRSSGWTKTPIR